jgi:hypothetical protein
LGLGKVIVGLGLVALAAGYDSKAILADTIFALGIAVISPLALKI